MHSLQRILISSAKSARLLHRLQRQRRVLEPCCCGTIQRCCSSNVIPPPHVEGTEKIYSPKVQSIVEDISQLTLVEVCDLNELLKKTLKIQDAPVMAMTAGPAAAPKEEDDAEEEVVPKMVKTSYTVKLTAFDAAKKIMLIKELKNMLPDMNLVQAKKFVESVPQVLKSDIGKDEAENIKTKIEELGGTAVVD